MNHVMKRNHVNIYGNGEQVIMFARGFGRLQRKRPQSSDTLSRYTAA